MVKIDRALRREGMSTKMLLQIHDELIFEVERAQIDAVAPLVKREMEAAFELAVPLEVTLKTGRTWYDVEPLDAEPVDA
jgi:DNA polymerase-1